MSRDQARAALEVELVALIATNGPLTNGEFRFKLMKHALAPTPDDINEALRRMRTRGLLTVSPRHPKRWDVASPSPQSLDPSEPLA